MSQLVPVRRVAAPECATMRAMADPGKELEHRKRFPLVVADKRAHHEAGIKRILGVTVPGTAAYAALSLELFPIAWVALPATILALLVLRPWNSLKYWVRKEDYREGDYSQLYYVSMFAPTIGSALSPALVGLFDDANGPFFHLPEAVTRSLGFVALWLLMIVGVSLTWRSLETFCYRIGKRRTRQLLDADHRIDDITADALDLAAANKELLATLVALGAVDGQWLHIKQLARHLDTSLDKLEAPIEELDERSLLDVRRIALEKPLNKWKLSVSPFGLRVLNHVDRR